MFIAILDIHEESNGSAHRDAYQDAIITVSKDVRPKKELKTRRLTDTQIGYKWRQQQDQEKVAEVQSVSENGDNLTISTYSESPSVKSIIIDASTLNKIVVPTNEQQSSISDQKKPNNATESSDKKSSKFDSKSVFVKTKRIIFSPFNRRNSKDKTALADSEKLGQTSILPKLQSFKALEPDKISEPKTSLFPQSPVLSRKEYYKFSPKETAPSIRIMIQRYNQKLQEDASSPASSGSGSPIWRSPASERRVKMQMEKYQEEVKKALAGTTRYDVQKSRSASVIKNIQGNEISKSTSVGSFRDPIINKQKINGFLEEGEEVAEESGVSYTIFPAANIILSNHKEDMAERVSPNCELAVKESAVKGKLLLGNISPELIHKLNALSTAKQHLQNSEIASENTTPLRIRAQRIRKAKEDFLSRGPSCYSPEPFAKSHRISTNSVASIDSIEKNDLTKSVSAGMINVDSSTYKKVTSAENLSKAGKNSTESIGRLSQIANKFRRAKLRRGKDKEKDRLSAVQMLCRQSLLVDIQGAGAKKNMQNDHDSSR